jgi:hypothetical protein
MKDGFGPYHLNVYELTLVIILTVLALSDISTDKLTACFSILCAFSGHLLGQKKQ